MDNNKKSNEKLTQMNFNEKIQEISEMDNLNFASVTNESINDIEMGKMIIDFESASKTDSEGREFWFARDLQKLLGYDRWENFLSAISRAKIACENSGQPIADHFRDVTKMIELGKGGIREIEDIKLRRYACYLITQNSDARKKPVAFGQSYFAIQTRRQELSDAVAVPSSEDEKRVYLRKQIKEHNRHLSSAAKEAGVVTSQEFAIFHSKGYQGLYGKTVSEIRRHKGLPANSDILDRMGSTELAANFFRVTQTEEKLRKEGIRGRDNAYATHYAVGRQVRDAMLKISGISPEDLPVVDSINNAEKRIKIENKDTLSLVAEVKPDNVSEESFEEKKNDIDSLRNHVSINIRTDLWKFALLIMATKPNGEISTTDLINELPNYIILPDGSENLLVGRKDTKFSQLVRNLKSHKMIKTNFIYQGYAEDYKGGFRITKKGLDFVKNHFSE